MSALTPTILPVEDRLQLEACIRRATAPHRDVFRASILLRLADGVSIADTAHELNCCTATVARWRKRYLTSGLPGLKDAPRSGQPTKITPEVRKRVLDMTVHSLPKEASHWSVRLMVKYAGITHW